MDKLLGRVANIENYIRSWEERIGKVENKIRVIEIENVLKEKCLLKTWMNFKPKST